MTTHRTRLEMMMEMLKMLEQEDCIRTRLAYGCNLNSQKGNNLLQELMEKGLVMQDGKMFLITLAGRDCLEAYNALRRLI